jgi:DNA-binding CsgD family transcriptional regulator
LTAAPACEVPLVDSGHEGFVIADLKGQIRHLSTEARRLLILATRPTIGAGIRSADLELPVPVVELSRRLAPVFNGRDASAPPACHLRNCLGGFTFRAYVLNQDGLPETAPEPAPLVGIHIRHQEPQTLCIVRRLGSTPGLLSQRQMQICLLLATGVPNAVIARQMNMSPHTVITHTRRLYEKLDVHNRSDLVAKLTAT